MQDLWPLESRLRTSANGSPLFAIMSSTETLLPPMPRGGNGVIALVQRVNWRAVLVRPEAHCMLADDFGQDRLSSGLDISSPCHEHNP